MIGYFLKAGDEGVSSMFTPYIWNEQGFATLWEKYFLNKTYGHGLKALLIMYYVEGKFAVNGPLEPKVGNYSKKNRDISVAITVTPEMFHNKNEFERREFIVNSTNNAIKLVREKSQSKKLDINFDELLLDIKHIEKEYLGEKNFIGT